MKQLLQNVYEDLNTEELFLINGGYSTTVTPRKHHTGNGWGLSSYRNSSGGISYEIHLAPGNYALPTSEELAEAKDVLSGGGKKTTSPTGEDDSGTKKEPIEPYDPDDWHCDINAYNKALEDEVADPGEWGDKANDLTVNDIYNDYYDGEGTDTPEIGTVGYGFTDNDGDGTYDHMFYYNYASGSGGYVIWDSDGKKPVTPYPHNGPATPRPGTTFVSIN